MAKVTIKGKKVKGTNKKDKITWQNSKAWKKALTVNALAGNDVINFAKSKYKNTIYGQAGKDTIYGGTKNDKIYGGAGNDLINAGKGTNTIYLKKKEGTDTIVKGGGSDTIVFSDEKNFNNFKFYYKNYDLIFSANGSTAKLKNFAMGGHSAKYIQAGNQKYKLSGKAGSTGNDLIAATSANDTITAGKGNDIINAGKGTNTIYHKAGDGNDIIFSGGGTDTLVFSDLSVLGDIRPSISGNNVIFTRENGEKVTLENALSGHSVKKLQTGNNKYDIVTATLTQADYDADAKRYDKTFTEEENKLVILNKQNTNTDMDVNFNNYNAVLFSGSGNNRISLGGGGIVYSANTGDFDNNCNYVFLNDATINAVYVDEGYTSIYADGRFCDIIVSDSNNETRINSVNCVDECLGVKIEKQDQTLNRYTPMFSYYNNDTISISSYDNSTKQITDENVAIKGTWDDHGNFYLNSPEFNNKFGVFVGGGDSSGAYLKLEDMSQLVDMNNDAIETLDAGTLNERKCFDFKTDNNGLLVHSKDVYIQGTTKTDYYGWDDNSSLLSLDKKFVINDKGGNSDRLYIDTPRYRQRFFFDIDINGNIAGDDLYIFYHSDDGIGCEAGQLASGLFQYFEGNIDNYGEENGYIVIENEFDSSKNTFTYGTGHIESIENSTSNQERVYNIYNLYDTIKENVAGWLGAYNTDYGTNCQTVTDAIGSGNNIWSVTYGGNNLYQIYSDSNGYYFDVK